MINQLRDEVGDDGGDANGAEVQGILGETEVAAAEVVMLLVMADAEVILVGGSTMGDWKP